MVNDEDSAFISRLRSRLRQKPGSRLFLSLAEELRKRDMIEEAVALLSDGSRQDPDFLAAKLTLGRWYLQGHKFSEAAAQFSEVLKKEPDNYFARKGLTEANNGLGITTELPEAAVGPVGPVISELAEVERLIAYGHYGSAMKLYQEMLINNPGDKLVLQRKEELAALIKFSEKKKDGKSGVLKQLNAFLDAIKIHFAAKAGNGQ
ncbi:MAG: hypothetical protein HQL08_08535 [Nitrospirae bacterium]|nr:hypothetical protein [Nitrospirota bacterium]